MGSQDVEFAEFFAAAWARVYRTTYAVAGSHALSHACVQDAFAEAYVDWRRVADAGTPESEVSAAAIDAVLTVFRKAPEQDSPAEFGPLTPLGTLISASPEERERADRLWAEVQGLKPEDRAAISRAAAAGSSADPQHLVEFLTASLEEIQIPPADLGQVISQGARRRRRRRWIAAGVAAALIALVAVPVALFAPQDKASSAKHIAGWREGAEAPLAPRWASLATWTGTEALFVGGFSQESCQDTTTCQSLRDGAAYNPETDTWRPIARAPFQIVANAPHAQFGDQLYIAGPRWVRYDASDDEWSELPPSPDPYNGGTVAAMGATILTVGPGARDLVQVFNGATDRWSVLPAAQASSRLRYRNLVGTAQGLVVLGMEGQELRSAHYVPSQWTVNPKGVKGGHSLRWSWTGDRLIHAEIVPVYDTDGERDGVRFAGGLALDPVTGRWDYLPIATAGPRTAEPWELYAEAGPLIAANGFVYDDRTTSWSPLGRPAQAPRSAVSAVWAGERLLAFGGANFTDSSDEIGGGTNRLWIYTHPGRTS